MTGEALFGPEMGRYDPAPYDPNGQGTLDGCSAVTSCEVPTDCPGF